MEKTKQEDVEFVMKTKNLRELNEGCRNTNYHDIFCRNNRVLLGKEMGQGNMTHLWYNDLTNEIFEGDDYDYHILKKAMATWYKHGTVKYFHIVYLGKL